MSHPNEVVHVTKRHDATAPVHPDAAPVHHTAEQLVTIHKEEAASVKAHAHLPDGSVIAEVAFTFVFPTIDHAGRTVPLHGGSHDHITHELLQYFSKPQTAVQGGFFVTVEGKSWSNATTVDEPWMVESFFKTGILPILRKKATSGVAYPFWPKASAGATDAAKAKIDMHLVPGHETALELKHEDHHCCVKVQTKIAKVSFKHFVQALVRESEALLAFMAKLDANVLGEATMKKFPNPERLGAYIDEVKTLI